MLRIPITVSKFSLDFEAATWNHRHRILNADVEAAPILLRKHAAIQAPNIEQIAFGLSAANEIVSIEVIGARFGVVDALDAPVPIRHGAVSVHSGEPARVLGVGSPHETIVYDTEADQLTFQRNADRTVFCVRFGHLPDEQLVAAGRHLSFGLAGQYLSSLWILNPTAS